jgi:hypothetical protein
MTAPALPIRPSRSDALAAVGRKPGRGLDVVPMRHAPGLGAAAPDRA